MFEDLGDRADFYVIYIAEAHAEDEWQVESNVLESVRLRQHTSFEERLAAAQLCADSLQLTIPTLVDGMDNAACEAFSAWPERIFIVDAEGQIDYRGGPGPYEFNPGQARASLMRLLAATFQKGSISGSAVKARGTYSQTSVNGL